MLYDELIEKAADYLDEKQLQQIKEAYEYAEKAHDGQYENQGSLISTIRLRWRKFSQNSAWIHRR